MQNLFWSTASNTVDTLKQHLKSSRLIRLVPFVELTYLFEIPKAIVVPELKLAFVPTPKVANRSMKAAIARRAGLPNHGDPHSVGWQYTPLALLQDGERYSFGFVRNPLDRLLSCYAQKIVLYARQMHMPLLFWRYGDKFRADMSFEEFVHAVAGISDRVSDIHFRSQHTFFYHKGRLMVDFVGRYERLQQDWATLQQRFGFGPLPHENRSRHKDYRAAYTPELARIAMQRYQRDIELFGYGDELQALLQTRR